MITATTRDLIENPGISYVHMSICPYVLPHITLQVQTNLMLPSPLNIEYLFKATLVNENLKSV